MVIGPVIVGKAKFVMPLPPNFVPITLNRVEYVVGDMSEPLQSNQPLGGADDEPDHKIISPVTKDKLELS